MNEQPTLNFDHANDQCSRILEFLKAGNRITPIDALNLFGCFRLGGRVYDLRKAGYKIERDMIKLKNGKRVAEYRLAS
jgi:Helix-turn-helix domain